MLDAIARDILRKHTADAIEASLEICCSSRENVSQAETIVRLSRQTIASSIALLSRTLSRPVMFSRPVAR